MPKVVFPNPFNFLLNGQFRIWTQKAGKNPKKNGPQEISTVQYRMEQFNIWHEGMPKHLIIFIFL